jgi:hypothetical protein
MSNLYPLNVFATGNVVAPKSLFYRGSAGSDTGTGTNAFPTNFITILSNMTSALNFTSTGLKITAPYACSFTISFSGAANGNNTLGLVNVASNIANTGNIRNDLLLYDGSSPSSGWFSRSVTIPVSSGEILTLSVSPASGVTYQIGNLLIVQGARIN